MDNFQFFNHRLSYIQQQYPITEKVAHIGERTVEIPIAISVVLPEFYVACDERYEDIVELGAVMPWWLLPPKRERALDKPVHVGHTVVDIGDPYEECVRIDGATYNYRRKLVFSISTLEHIGLPEYGQTENRPEKAVETFIKITNEAKLFFLNWPIGHNRVLDDYVRNDLPKNSYLFMMQQITQDNRWELLEEPNWSLQYGSPFMYANGLIFVTNLNLE